MSKVKTWHMTFKALRLTFRCHERISASEVPVPSLSRSYGASSGRIPLRKSQMKQEVKA